MNYKKGDVVELYYSNVPEYFEITHVGVVWVYVQNQQYGAEGYFKFMKNDPHRLLTRL
jgi:hypothetical protein